MPPKPDPRVAEPSASAGYARAVEPAADACVNPSVAASFEEFAELDDEAAEMEMEPPSSAVKQTAKRILTALTQEFPRYYAVSLDEDGGIAIETGAGTGKGHGVLIICDEENVSCYVTKGGKSWQEHSPITDKNLPSDFIRNAIQDLE